MEDPGITEDLRRCCLFFLTSCSACVRDSELHFVLHCPLLRDLRTDRVREIEIGSEFGEFPPPSVALLDVLSWCARELARIQFVGTFVRLSLKMREQWLQENVSGGLQLTHTAQVGLPAAQLHSINLGFRNGAAISI